MPTSFGHFFVWLLCFGLTLDAALGARKELRSRENISKASSASNSICNSRVVIYGYPCEDHTVTTEDGYILGIERIPHGRSGSSSGSHKTPVLLQHGLLMTLYLGIPLHASDPPQNLQDGITWLLNSPDESLAYILADNGYDVWIANSRGTVESLGHTSLSPSDPAYWNWSWDELAAYDLPATFQYIHQKTGKQKIHYVAHSLGTLLALASLCEHNLLNMFRSAVLLSPIAYMDQMPSPLNRAAADLFAAEAYYWLGLHEFDPNSQVVHDLLTTLCKLPGINCYDMMTCFTGKNCCLNSSTIQIYQDHEPQATATKNMIHLSQMIRTGTVTKYDYGNEDDNMANYGQATPPVYNLSNIPNDLPLFIGYGGKDLLSDVNDVDHLLDTLKFHDVDKLTVRYVADYAHADLSMGVTAKQMLYDSMMAFFKLH